MASREVLVVGRNLRAAFALAGPSGVAEAIAAFVGDDSQEAEGLLEEGFGGAAHWWLDCFNTEADCVFDLFLVWSCWNGREKDVLVFANDALAPQSVV